MVSRMAYASESTPTASPFSLMDPPDMMYTYPGLSFVVVQEQELGDDSSVTAGRRGMPMYTMRALSRSESGGPAPPRRRRPRTWRSRPPEPAMAETMLAGPPLALHGISLR